jgi:DNA-binding HxlR family transcriptional regulator
MVSVFAGRRQADRSCGCSTCWAGAGPCASSGKLREQPKRFRDLQDLIGASPTIVNTRLAELREAKLVELDEAVGYRLTALGKELLLLFLPLHTWSEKWAKALG